jgi:hypothetical protein
MPESTKLIIAYGLVIVLANVWHFIGTLPVSFVVAGCLAKASQRVRGVVAGVLSGLGGVAASVAVGYFVFRLMFGSNAFSLFPLLAATVPLLISIRKDFAKSRLLFADIANSRHVFRNPAVEDRLPFVNMAVGVRFRAVGTILGVALAVVWLFTAHDAF